MMRITFRLNSEYDADIIKELENFKNNNLSEVIRNILREHLCHNNNNNNNVIDNDSINYNKIIKWNFPG